MLRILNTLSGQLEEFRPLVDGEAKFYYCGPTVWDYGHIGNFRSAIAADLIRRYLKFKGLRVTSVMNLTDVDDRIITQAEKAGQTLDEYTAKYIEAFWEDFDALGCERPDVAPRATRHIAEMADLVEKLEQRGHAYRSEDSIYYRISSFPDYGKLSKISFEGNIAGGSQRVDTDKYEKEDARDFALWKAPNTPDEPAWDSKIGRGRPGWHLECSAMSMKYLGESFDLHAGGVDLIFPHHENEIAQSEGATGKPFVRTWFHAEFLLVEGEKMSKSKGNYYTVRDLIKQGFSPMAIRYLLVSVPYRTQLNFTLEGLRGAESATEKLRNFRRRVKEYQSAAGTHERVTEIVAKAREAFEAGMNDDLNTSSALAALHDLRRDVNIAIDAGEFGADDRTAVLDFIERVNAVLGVLGAAEDEQVDAQLVAEIDSLIDERNAARKNRDFKRADEIRHQLGERGILLEDTPQGTKWKRK